jgi:TolB-like protein/class 3 adenylate cyclase
MEERQPRKLAVILHADVVGSTMRVQQNESLAHARIQDAFRRLSSTIEGHNGVARELRGDALVAEFARASDAVAAGLTFQIENSESNARLEDELQPRLRIGISLGEVVIADDTITGTGVVLAQRVEQLAESGGVCITGAIHEAVPRHLPIEYSDLGKREVKGFEELVQVYSASVKAGKQVPVPEPAVSVGTQSRKPKRSWTAVAIALLVLVVGGLAWWQPWVPREEPASIERMAFSLPDKPSIAVLPFTNMSGDAEQEYFVDGMTEDLITDLSKLSGLFVIARNSTFTYKGKSVKVRQIAEELGVRYVLEGTNNRSTNRRDHGRARLGGTLRRLADRCLRLAGRRHPENRRGARG